MEIGLVELSRLQFAMTALYHFLFVPLTLGLSILVALAAGGQSLLTEIDTAIPARAPSHFIVDVPKQREADLRRVAQAAAPGGEVRVVPSLRGSVTAVNGVPVAELPEAQRSWLVDVLREALDEDAAEQTRLATEARALLDDPRVAFPPVRGRA